MKYAYAAAQRKCLGLAPGAKAGRHFSAIHWHPNYAKAHPKRMGRLPTLLDPLEAAKYRMITTWNKVTTTYDGSPKVLAIPNHLGVIQGEYVYDDVRSRAPPIGRRKRSVRLSWSPELEQRKRKRTEEIHPPNDGGSDVPPQPGTIENGGSDAPPQPSTIENGAYDGAKKAEWTGMRAEFTSKDWFDNKQGKRHRRMYSWYGYGGGRLEWRHFMALLTQVHFVNERDMRIPKRWEREDRSRGCCLTNLEKCLLTKMFITTGLEFTKIADLWGCDERTVSNAVRYWEPRWREVATKYSRLRVWDGYLKACQPSGWDGRYKHPISHMTDGSVIRTNTPRKSSPLSRLFYNSKVEHAGALGITLSTPTGMCLHVLFLYCGGRWG